MCKTHVMIFLFNIFILSGCVGATGRPAVILTTTREANFCDHIIGHNVSVADARSNYSDVSPGDTVCIEAGTRNYLFLRNFVGTAEKPITFINFGGQVVIYSTKNGITIQNSRYFHLAGTGSAETYGFRVIHAANHGIFAWLKISEFEIDHIEVENVSQVGILSADYANCSDGSTNNYDYDGDGKIKGDLDDVLNRDSFTQTNSILHHNYIHDVGAEGIYLGSSFYAREQQLDCARGTERRYDPILVGVQIFDNRIVNTGWDGIQVGSALENCNIHHNQIYQDSQAKELHQQSGIMNNPGSVCNIYNNSIKDGTRTGIFIQGSGNNRVYNNVIVNPGQNSDAGNGITIVVGSNLGNSIYVWHNTIIAPKNYGIEYFNSKGADNRIQNNLIIAPGNYDSEGEKAYIQTWGKTNVTVSDNLFW